MTLRCPVCNLVETLCKITPTKHSPTVFKLYCKKCAKWYFKCETCYNIQQCSHSSIQRRDKIGRLIKPASFYNTTDKEHYPKSHVRTPYHKEAETLLHAKKNHLNTLPATASLCPTVTSDDIVDANNEEESTTTFPNPDSDEISAMSNSAEMDIDTIVNDEKNSNKKLQQVPGNMVFEFLMHIRETVN